MFTKSAQFYDVIYGFKDYRGEVEQLLTLIGQHKTSKGDRLLDAGCGTGKHLQFLKKFFSVEGFDLDEDLLDLAHQRLPDVLLHLADMTALHLGKQYDVITCLFSVIGYVETEERLRMAAEAFRNHLAKGGLLIVEAWFTPDEFHPGTVTARFIDEPDTKIARMSLARVEGTISCLDFHYMVGRPGEIASFAESHRLGLFTHDQYFAAFEDAGFRVTLDPEGISGRGLFICEVVD